MKCSKCSGAGYIYNNLVGYAEDCSVCHGKGEVLTHEEWLKQCNTEQLAEVLFSWYKLGRLDVINKHTEVKKDWLIGWLKQPHTPIS